MTLEKPFASSAPSSVSESELKPGEKLLSLSHEDQIKIAPITPLTLSHTPARSPFAVCVKVISQTQLRNCYLYSNQAAEYPVKRDEQ